MQSVHVVDDEHHGAEIGDLVEVEIAAAWPNSVTGVMVKQDGGADETVQRAKLDVAA